MNRGIGIVTTRYGKMQGVEENGITSFRGVPYAKPPIGELRWRAPEKPEPWEGVRDCTKFGKIPVQLHGQCAYEAITLNEQSEDCLYLNIWTPAQNPGERLPVIFWIHGGAFLGGLGHDSLYLGNPMASRGVIEVTINYRLGAIGFLAHPELSAENARGVSGNYGILDQIQALRWVKENIAAFGGDPERITVAGQSAGGMSVCTLLTSPLTAGLISGGIIESGGPTKGRGGSLKSCEEFGEKFMAAAGCSSIEELRKKDAKELISMQVGEGRMPFQPNVDGWVLPMTPYEAFTTGNIARVPVMFGCNTEEGMFVMARGSYEEKLAAIREQLGEDYDEFAALYPLSEDKIDRSLMEAGRDAGFANLRRVAKIMEDVHPAPVYQYFFAQPMEKADGEYIGVTHSAELYYVFDNLQCVGRCNLGPEMWEPKLDHDAYELAHTMCSYWAEFTKKGDPNRPGLPAWPAYDSESQCHMYLKGGEIIARPTQDPERIDFIDRFVAKNA
ncbi:MAG: carboxylesterase family protein [Ruminococcaceae bacterium]|nr:carboxylesterase family protein [Oscillospiraceae bacterium]